jgi:hypothetical protein
LLSVHQVPEDRTVTNGMQSVLVSTGFDVDVEVVVEPLTDSLGGFLDQIEQLATLIVPVK